MKIFRLFAFSFLFLIPVTIFAQFTIDDRAILFSNVNVVPMTEQTVMTGMDVLVEGDRISAIGQTGELSVPTGASVIDAEGKYLMPGLAEMHGHVPPMESGNWPERYLEDVLYLYLAGGITTVRGMLGQFRALHCILPDPVLAGNLSIHPKKPESECMNSLRQGGIY